MQKINRRDCITALAGTLIAPSGLHSFSRKRPNVVVILADDQGWGDLSINGNSNLSTPHIDSLAADGALLDRFYVCSLCAPTRAEFLTGRYHSRGGVRGVDVGFERLDLDERTIGDTFKAAGYRTAAFGKWHSGSQHPYHPNARGFDEFYGFTSGHWGQYFDPELDHNGTPVRGKGFIIDDLTDHALDYIAQNREHPFFCYLPLNTPHSPMQVPDRFFQRFANLQPQLRAKAAEQEDIAMTRAALAMCENIDWNVGRVLAKLDELKLRDKTIVIYFSDNGPNSWRWNGGMKGRKGSVDEGGLRVPFLIRWPGMIGAGYRITQIAGAIDLLPTLADLAGISTTSSKPLDGRSLKPLLSGRTETWPDRMLFSLRLGWETDFVQRMEHKKVTVRNQRYRLDPSGRLFDIDIDPGQEIDVAERHPDITERLQRAATEWGTEMLSFIGPDDRPFPVGYAKWTRLPASDGAPEGGVERSARFPNCSYFTKWTSTQGRMTWDIEVARTAEYAAEILYTCPAADIGSTLELSFRDSCVRGKVVEAHDPPLVGAAFDRVKREEAYVKDFRPLSLGTIRLPKGRGRLILSAVEIAGTQVADIRGVSLTRV
jgi:arylsulfatase A-like enzyme